MKKLTKMMLTKWHYFEHKIIDFDDINFLTGKNSSGKSTLIDAMQVVLLGETDGTSFNKAADIKANRSFTSYIIGELGDDVNGGEKSLRGGKEFTTQLVCEFKDTMNDEYFCIGILVDSYSDMANAKRVFFRLRDRLDESDYIYNNQPRNINQFKSWCREKYGKDDKTIKFMDTNTEYRQNILSMYNVHDRKMFTLLKKSISFKRIDNIENFITENICDVKNEIDIRSMQLNVYEYEKQKEKADQLEKQERELAEINNLYEKYSNKKRNIKVYNYISNRCEEISKTSEIDNIKKEIETKTLELNTAKTELEIVRKNITQYNKDNENAIKELDQCEQNRLYDELTKNIDISSQIIDSKNKNINFIIPELRGKSAKINSKLNSLKDSIANKITSYENLVDEKANSFISEIKTVNSGFNSLINTKRENFNAYSLSYFKDLKDKSQNLMKKVYGFKTNTENCYNSLLSEKAETEEELKKLKKGKKHYSKDLLKLRDNICKQLKEKYKKDIEVNILADLIDIDENSEVWRNAVEGYLGNQKFNLIIEPEYFMDAYYIYKNMRKEIYSFGIVDCERILNAKKSNADNSLADVVVTDNKYADAYIKYLLGRVSRCKDDEEIRKYNIGITSECMLYQGFTVRAINPENYKIHYIGNRAIEQQIKYREQQLVNLTDNLTVIKNIFDAYNSLTENTLFMNDEYIQGQLSSLFDDLKTVNIEEDKRSNLIAERSNIDMTTARKIEQKIKKIKENLKELDEEQSVINNTIGGCNNAIESNKDRLNVAENELKNIAYNISREYSDFTEKEKAEERLATDIETNSDILKLKNDYRNKVFITNRDVNNLNGDIRAKKENYNRNYNISLAINENDNFEFNDEWERIKNISLPQYKDKIAVARKESMEQFQSDFLDKMRDNIMTAQQQIKEINEALKLAEFGSDKYSFEVKPEKAYMEYYNMIMADRMGGDSIFDLNFQQQYGDTCNNLFDKITSVSDQMTEESRKELDNNISLFTDYRTYLKFDLYVTNATGRKESLVNGIKSKSGGERQTPFYVSFLATFAQLYKVNEFNYKGNTARLVIFDEAFNNMDNGRIDESIELLRKLGLQAIICAPDNKIANISTKADKTLVLYREGRDIDVFDFDKEMKKVEASL